MVMKKYSVHTLSQYKLKPMKTLIVADDTISVILLSSINGDVGGNAYLIMSFTFDTGG